MKNTQALLERSSFVKSNEFLKYENGPNVPFMYLSPLNKGYSSGETVNVAYNLYITKMTELNGYDRKDFIGKTVS